MKLKSFYHIYKAVFMSVVLFFVQACVAPTEVPTATVIVATKISLSQQVMLTSISFNEEGQSPVYKISAQTPMFSGSDAQPVQDFNKTVRDLVQKEINYFRNNILAQMPLHPISSGSAFNAQYELIFQQGNIWSLKFDFSGYAD